MRSIEQDFDVLDKLGEGGFGTVYKVRSKKTGDFYALKLMSPDLKLDNEIGVMKLLTGGKHCQAHLVCYHEYGLMTWRGEKFMGLLMDYIPGSDLMEIAQTHHFTASEVWAVAQQMLPVLSFLTKKRVAHRDVKLENIMFDGKDYILVDFGLACGMKTSQPSLRCHSAPGTPYYSAPEVYTREVEKNPLLWSRSDIWALGVVLYALLNDDFPFKPTEPTESEAELQAVKKAVLTGEREEVRTKDEDLKVMIDWMLQPRAEDRPSADEVMLEFSDRLRQGGARRR